MSSADYTPRVDEDHIIDYLLRLNDPGDKIFEDADKLIELKMAQYRSPFFIPNGEKFVDLNERLFVAMFVRLGAAVRLAEVQSGWDERDDDCGFYDEVDLAVRFWMLSGDLDEETLPSDPIYWDNLIPSCVAFGYGSVSGLGTLAIGIH